MITTDTSIAWTDISVDRTFLTLSTPRGAPSVWLSALPVGRPARRVGLGCRRRRRRGPASAARGSRRAAPGVGERPTRSFTPELLQSRPEKRRARRARGTGRERVGSVGRREGDREGRRGMAGAARDRTGREQGSRSRSTEREQAGESRVELRWDATAQSRREGVDLWGAGRRTVRGTRDVGN